jgi:hypothetical protein
LEALQLEYPLHHRYWSSSESIQDASVLQAYASERTTHECFFGLSLALLPSVLLQLPHYFALQGITSIESGGALGQGFRAQTNPEEKRSEIQTMSQRQKLMFDAHGARTNLSE